MSSRKGGLPEFQLAERLLVRHYDIAQSGYQLAETYRWIPH
ncbi:hypothetical protein [Synechococcus sp. PCC 7336]|nr:hypothetical protein [Synechococcus sp. PCC 7336]